MEIQETLRGRETVIDHCYRVDLQLHYRHSNIVLVRAPADS